MVTVMEVTDDLFASRGGGSTFIVCSYYKTWS
jgi:hypothetical protein